jgi:hypothetical protein
MDTPRHDPLAQIRNERLSMLLLGERCKVTFIDAALAPLTLRIKRAGMDYVAGETQAEARYVIPLTAIAFVEFPP